jgi:type I restriction enzyme S subunit
MILGQTRARISMDRLAGLVVPVLPLPLQKEFAQRVTEVRELEAVQVANRQRLEALFQSLLHRAFNGEL